MEHPSGAIDRIRTQALRRLTPGQRYMLAAELSEFTRRLFKDGLRKRFPELDDQALHALYLERLAKCYNSNY